MRSRLVVGFKGIELIVELVHDLVLPVLDRFQLEGILQGATPMGSDIMERQATFESQCQIGYSPVPN